MAATITTLPGQRGPAEHAMRERVVASAHAMFRANGFSATSMVEIAADLDVAPTYLYKFFRSKTAIGEAVCASILDGIDDALWAVARSNNDPARKLALLFSTMLKENVGMFFAERRLHDLVAHSLEQNWASIAQHKEQIRAVLAHIFDEGVAMRAFDSTIDREEAIEALFWALHPFAHPRLLEQSIEHDLEGRAGIIGRFCVRALQPSKNDLVTV
jgi:AcrR family transcriptional regulator